MESPIKKMLLNELIKEHEKELLLGGNLGETTLNNNTNNARKKMKIYEDETEEETEDAIARSNSSTDACFTHALFHHNTFSSEPIPIPVADLQLRYDTQRVVKRLLFFDKMFLFSREKKVVLPAKVDLLSHVGHAIFSCGPERESAFWSRKQIKIYFFRKELSKTTLSLELLLVSCVFL